MSTIESVLNNGHAPTLRELRNLAARLGIPNYSDKAKLDLIEDLGKIERDMQRLREKCALNGLSSEGSIEELQLRLIKNQSGTTTHSHRRTYYYTAGFGVLLGLAGLGVSLPHLALEISTLMNIHFGFAMLFALVLDGGFITMKVIDTLGSKFEFRRSQYIVIWSVMISCLLMSASLNASQFLRHVGTEPLHQSLAVGLAIFISLFVFSMFYMSCSMVVRCENRKPVNSQDPVEKFAKLSKEMERLIKLAERA